MRLVDTSFDPFVLGLPEDTVVDFHARFRAISEVPRPRIKRVREPRFAVCARLVRASPPPPETEEDVAGDTQVMMSPQHRCAPPVAHAVACPHDLPRAWAPSVAAREVPRPARTKSVTIALAGSLMACLSVAVPAVLARADGRSVLTPVLVASAPRNVETMAAREVTIHSAALAVAKSPQAVRERGGARSLRSSRFEVDAHGF
jgi:hypothetical protein